MGVPFSDVVDRTTAGPPSTCSGLRMTEPFPLPKVRRPTVEGGWLSGFYHFDVIAPPAAKQDTPSFRLPGKSLPVAHQDLRHRVAEHYKAAPVRRGPLAYELHAGQVSRRGTSVSSVALVKPLRVSAVLSRGAGLPSSQSETMSAARHAA